MLNRFAIPRKLGYTLLSDPKSEIIGAFGLINEATPRTSDWYGYAHPIIFVVDANGVIRHRFSETNYQNRPEVDAILDILRREAKG